MFHWLTPTNESVVFIAIVLDCCYAEITLVERWIRKYRVGLGDDKPIACRRMRCYLRESEGNELDSLIFHSEPLSLTPSANVTNRSQYRPMSYREKSLHRRMKKRRIYFAQESTINVSANRDGVFLCISTMLRKPEIWVMTSKGSWTTAEST